ncbi:programmed cell death protein 11 [Sarcoptes scabiei]|nr:programmed cell death protein 11 [Sarcoptes scabiei]
MYKKIAETLRWGKGISFRIEVVSSNDCNEGRKKRTFRIELKPRKQCPAHCPQRIILIVCDRHSTSFVNTRRYQLFFVETGKKLLLSSQSSLARLFSSNSSFGNICY